MNEERAGREGSSRGSGGSRGGFGAAGGPTGESVSLPRQAEQARGAGMGRRRAAAAEFGPTELAAALNRSVATVGTGGPPRAGLARIRRRAKARQRRRTAMAGSAGVLVLAMGVAAVTGSSFDIVPVLTGVVGLGSGSTSSQAPTPTPQSGGAGQVRTVRPSPATVGKKGPAIGPVAPAAASAALAASGVAPCTAADLKTTASVDSVIGGASYGHVEAVANTTCAVAGPPVLQVQNVAGTAVGSVVILRHEATDGSQLPSVSTWGAVLKLQAGQGYDLQFAWAPDACTGAGSGPVGTASGTPTSGSQGTAPASGGASGGSGATDAAPNAGSGAGGAGNGGGASAAAAQSAQSAYSLSYLVAGVTPTAPVSLNAACGATVYVTDIYNEGAYPLPQPPVTPTPQPSTTSAPTTTSQSPTAQTPTSGAPATTASSTPAPPSSSPTTSTVTPSASSPATSNAPNEDTPADPPSS